MSVEIDAREVLKYLNELGYCDISTRQLKEFIRDLKILIKYDNKKNSRRENQENIQPVSSESYYYPVLHDQSELSASEYDGDTEEIAVQTQRHENYLSEIFSTLHCNSTVSSRAKSCPKKQSDQNIISVEILKPKPSRPFSSSCTTSGKLTEVRERPTSSTLTRTKYTVTSSDSVSEPPQFTGSSRTGRRTKSSDNLGNGLKPKVSFIRPRKPMKVSKSDPVALYQQYQEEWKKQKLPGEDKRYNLRWAIRERMLGEPDVVPRTSMEKISRKGSRI